MKRNIFILILTAIFVLVQAQSERKVLRSTSSMMGSSRRVETHEQAFIVHQSVGQASPIGLAKTDYCIVRQGFIQPFEMVSFRKVEDLDARIYPNPMKHGERLTVHFDGLVETDIKIIVVDMLGYQVGVFNYPAMQDVVLDLDHLNPGGYAVQVQANDVMVVLKMLKQAGH